MTTKKKEVWEQPIPVKQSTSFAVKFYAFVFGLIGFLCVMGLLLLAAAFVKWALSLLV